MARLHHLEAVEGLRESCQQHGFDSFAELGAYGAVVQAVVASSALQAQLEPFAQQQACAAVQASYQT